MFINMNKKRISLTIIGLFLISLPLFYKSSHNGTSAEAEKKSPYGQCLKWYEVNRIIPLYAVFAVVDLETGLQFCVQRRGGYYHADVQPLTAEDSAMMKKIYAGKWSWKRRAVIVQMDDGIRIAASMNGMPHGQGAIKDNQFNGHFCIHFADSKTHGSKRIDLAHQMMIWKSANILDKQLKSISCEKTMEIFFTALNQGDKTISTKIIASQDQACWKVLREIESIRVCSIAKHDDQNSEYLVSLRVKYKNAPAEISQKIIIKLSKEGSVWEIKPETLFELHV